MLKRNNRLEDDSDAVETDEIVVDGAVPPRLEQTAAEAELADDSEIQAESDEEEFEEEEEHTSYFDRDTVAFGASLLSHLALILGFAAIPIIHEISTPDVVLQSVPIEEPLEQFDVISEIVYSEDPSEKIGANSIGQSDVALSAAPTIADLSEIVTPEVTPSPISTMDLSINVQQAVALTESTTSVRGMTGFGVSGTEGAVDRITYEIIKSIEERPTLVVWLFDASVSLSKRRDEIRGRFDKVYEEIGLVTEERIKQGKVSAEEPLLTSVFSFGNTVNLLLDKPTSDLNEIRKAIDEIEVDSSGVEMVFSAIHMAADKFKRMRIDRGDGPERNVLLIAVTDERGDDTQGMDQTIDLCRRFAIPVHILGVPAPFGRSFTYIKYVDPDPKYDQSPRWAQIDQGPETLMPERVQIGYKDNFYEEPMIDSGFGPYALSRICYETGGIFFTIHPNRNYDRDVSRGSTESFASHLQRFFDPEVMDRYRPDYLSAAEYEQMVRKNPLRATLIQASQLARTGVLEAPKTRFVKRDEASFTAELATAQQDAARLDPGLNMLCQVLSQGENGRKTELSARWLASYDLSFATANAERIRNETYNQMLGKARRGMNFQDAKNNTWTLVPSKEISVNSRLQKEADDIVATFERIVKEHAGTPWAYLARRELERPIGWEWKESFTDLNPPPRMAQNPGNNNNNVPMPANEQARMLKPPPPQRPIPKL